MNPIKLRTLLLAAVVGGAMVGDAVADVAPPANPSTGVPAPAVQPTAWEKTNDCSWWLANTDGKSLRASIEQDPDGLSITFGDLIFNTWPEGDRPKVEVRFNRDPKRRFVTDGWSTHGEGFAMFGLYVPKTALKKMGGAKLLELRRKGKPVLALTLTNTPSAAELKACLPPPQTGPSDSE